MSVYVALLEKIETLDTDCFEGHGALASDAKSWIALGHFDAMHTYELKLENKNLFQAIQQNNRKISKFQQDNRYFHPLYMISSEDTQQFWENLGPFFAIVKIHFADSVNSDHAYEQLLKKLQEHSKQYHCVYCTFRTIELSDMILAVTADGLSALLEFALTLRVYSCVGKVYTYACVDYDLVKEKEWQPLPNDHIDLFSMRFSVADFHQAKDTIDYIESILDQEQAFSVSGVDDIVVNWSGLKTYRLIQLYRSWFWDKDRPKGLFGQCFAEVTTRVGILLDKMGVIEDTNGGNGCGQEPLKKNCENLYACCESICLHASQQNLMYNWIEPLSALTSTLVRISKTSVLDEFVYIMYAGVDAFLKNVKYQIEHMEELNTVQCQYFVESWAHLMEHVMRVEGQLTHNPQMRPILYDIPVAMLEYVLSFLKQVSEILQTKDAANKKDICFLLVPRLCDRIEAQELFPAVPNGLPGLVLVTIPLQMLYDSKEIQQELSHEVSHFVGEAYRNRADRAKKYIQASAALMSRVFFGAVHPAFVRAIQAELVDHMGNVDDANIIDLSRKVMEWVDRICKRRDEYVRFIRRVLEMNIEHTPLKLNPTDTFITGGKVQKFQALLADLRILFRKIYADICTLYLLPITGEEYVASILPDLVSEKDEAKRRYEQIAIRIYVGMKAGRRSIPLNYILEQDEKLGKEIQTIETCLENGDEMQERLIPITSIRFLLLYAKRCYERLCEEPQQGLEKIREMYDNVAILQQMDYKRFTTDINEYRIKILN